MLIDLVVPDLGLSSPLQLGQWLVDVGARVLQGHGLVEITAEGVLVELPSPVDGVLRSILVSEDETIVVGGRLGIIEAETTA